MKHFLKILVLITSAGVVLAQGNNGHQGNGGSQGNGGFNGNPGNGGSQVTAVSTGIQVTADRTGGKAAPVGITRRIFP